MARDKSAIAAVVLFFTLGLGALAGWIARGTTSDTPPDQAIGAVQPSPNGVSSAESSILLPRSATDDTDPVTDDPQDSVADDDVSESTPSTTTSETAPRATAVDEPSATSSTVVAPTTTGPAGAPTTTASPTAPTTTTATSPTTTTAAPTTTAPTTTTTTTTVVLTDPSFRTVQFQSPIACIGGAAVVEVSWETIDASGVAILINGQSIAAELAPAGVLDANFACDGDGVHDVELVATGISSDPARTAFTSSVTDQITTEG